MNSRKYTTTTFFSVIAATFIISLPAVSSYGQNFPATDPPTEEKITEPIENQKEKQAQIQSLTATTEWLYHKTADGKHPDGMEQRQLWFINRARSNPTVEGSWLSTEPHRDVSNGRSYFGVDLTKLQDEFTAISQMPPAAFDRRLYEAAKVHSQDLIARDAQDHTDQFNRVTASGFEYLAIAGVVFSYTDSGLHAHAAFNIDWGNEPDGMQSGRGHRVALMSDGKEYTNVGISSIYVTDGGKKIGPYVTTGNYAKANTSTVDHFNAFIVGTVWSDTNSNGWYEDGEGLSGVTVMPSIGTYYAVTADSGGYAIPITETGTATVNFSGGALPASDNANITLSAVSQLVDFMPIGVAIKNDFPWAMFLPAITHKKGGDAVDCHGDTGGTAVLDSCGVCGGDDSTCGTPFERSSSGNIVTDNTTQLMWQDSPLAFRDEAGGILYCNEKSFDGYQDWRLPTFSELQDFFKRVSADHEFDLNYWGTFEYCTASVAIGGYVRTPYGAKKNGGETGDSINFRGGAAARCVR